MDLNIVFSVDNRGVDMMAVAMYSVIKNNQKHKLDFYVIHSSITDENQVRLKKLAKKFTNTAINFVIADSKKLDRIPVTNKNTTKEAYYRYLAPDLIPTNEERALYMDFDMLCLADLGELYTTDLKSNYIGAVPEHFVTDDNPTADYLFRQLRKEIGFTTQKYINSGLILMDLGAIRRSKIMDEFWMSIRNKNKLLSPRVNIFSDQTITNLVFKNKTRYLDARYNVFTTALKDTKQKNGVIIHYTGSHKPFTYRDEYSSEYDDLYADYYAECIGIIGGSRTEIIKFGIQRIHKDAMNVDQTKYIKLLEATLHAREAEVAGNKQQISNLTHQLEKIHNSRVYKLAKSLKHLKDKITK